MKVINCTRKGHCLLLGNGRGAPYECESSPLVSKQFHCRHHHDCPVGKLVVLVRPEVCWLSTKGKAVRHTYIFLLRLSLPRLHIFSLSPSANGGDLLEGALKMRSPVERQF